MKRRKILALLTVGALLAGTLSGCGGDSGASGDAGSAGSTGEAAGESADAQGGGDDTSPITFEYYNADGKDDGWRYTGRFRHCGCDRCQTGDHLSGIQYRRSFRGRGFDDRQR